MKTTDRMMKVWVQNGPRSAKRTRPPTRGGWLTMAVAVLAVLATGAADLRAADAVPDVSLGGPGSTRLGSDFSFTAAFDNASADQTGYGPYVDIAIDATGPDGDPDDPGADPLDGIDIAASGAVTHLGAPVTYHLLTFDDDANGGQGIAHPYAVDSGGNPITVKTTDFPGGTFENGDILLVALLPFGSFTPEQPAAVLNIDATLSDLADTDKTHDFSARGGFQYGNDPIENPSTDPSITQPTPDDADLQPTLWDLSKVYIGPEDETATGPNFTREYVLEVDIADGQTIDDVIVTDELPIEMQFVEIVDATKNGGAYTDPTPTLPSTSIPGGTLEYSFGTITGGPGVDATVTFKWFIPRLDANSDVIIAANTGDDVLSENQAWAEGHWDPIDTRDPELDVYAQATAGGPDADPEHTLEDQSNAIQKGGAIVVDNGGAGFTPDDVVEYTLEIQISDYFAFDDLIVDDLLGDGQVFDDSFTPTLSISEHGSSSSGDFDIANYTETTNRTADGDPAPNDGTTALQFRISDELVARGLNANLTGGGIDSQTTGLSGAPRNNPPMVHGGTTATITYRAIVSDEYSDDYPSGDAPLNPGDGVGNSVVLDGRLLDPADNLNPYPGDPREDDDSGAGFSIPLPELTKGFHAINGDTDPANWIVDPSGNPNVQPGDTVTFRLTYELPSRDLEDFSLTDYVPLPVFHVDDPDEDGSAGPAWTFDAVYPGDATPPAAGHAKFGPDESFHPIRGAYPAVTINTANGNNTLIFDYGTADDPTNTPGTVDILFTVTVADDPFADGLFLTNQVRASEQDTDLAVTKQDKIVNFVLNQPEVTIHKGVVGYRDTGLTLGGITFTAPDTASSFAPTPAYSPSQASAIGASDLLTNEVDADDEVRFAIMVRNGGRSDAFDVNLTDAVPAGFDIPANLTAMDLTVRRGDGTLLTQGADYTASIDGAGNVSLELTDNYTAGNLGGDDDSGALSRGYNAGVDGDVTNGSNAVILTYDLIVADDVEALDETTNTATLTNYAGVEGGEDHTPTNPTDDATVNFRPAAIDKVFDTTEIDDAGTTGHNTNGEAVIGEISSYTLTVTVPEGVTADAVLTDTLDSGLAFIQVTGVTASADLTIENPIGTGANPANATVSNAGRTVEYNFGDITNSNTDNGTAETITITYEAVVLNVAGNQEGTQLNNVAAFDYKNNGAPITDASATITVIEPVVTVDKQVSENVGGPWVDNNGELDAGDTFYYRIRITNPAADSTVAYNLLLTDDLPAALGTSVIHSVTADNYDASDFEILGGTVQVKASQNPDGLTLSPGETIDIFLENTVGSSVEPTQPIDNEDATVTWTSLDDGNTTPENPPERSTHNTSSVERSGDDGEGGAVDDYEDVDDTPASITVRNPDPTKTLVATSESHTAGNRVAVGEIARYRIAWQIPEGQTTDLNFLDRIPNGLVFLDDGTAKLAFVSNDPSGGLSSGDPALSGPGLDISGDSGAVTPTFVIPAGAISPAGFDSGTDVTFDLGTVTNNDRDSDGEYIVIEFNALVHNDTTHQNDAGDERRNNFRVRTGATVLGTSPNETVRISEPQLSISKGVSAGPYDAGDTVTYTLTVTNAGGANATTAFDIVIADTLPAELVAPALDSTATTGTVVGLAASFAGNDLTATATSMDAGATIEIVYSATIESDLPAGADIVNDADVVYTSLPGAGTTGNPTGSDTPGASGDEDGERNGSGTGANDYNDDDTAPIEGDKPSVDKSFQDGSITDDDTNVATSFGADVVIGETVVFDLLVTVPEGETAALRVNDALPAGLRLDSYDVLTDAADSTLLGSDFNGTVTDTPAVSPALPADGAASVEFDFGTTTVVDDNDGTNNAFVLRLTATVTNIASNQSGVDRENTATVTFNDPDTGGETLPDANAGNDPEVTVVEPVLEIEKTADPTTADSGDTVVYTFEITNTSDQMAYDVDLLDTLPDKLNGPAILTGANFAAAGFYDAAVQAATTADIANLATAPATIDGYALSEDDLVLVKDQADPADNGIYIVDSVAGTADLVRWTDFDEAAEVTQRYLARVDNGATHAGTVFRQTETLGSVGTDPIVWTEYGAYAIPAADDFEIFVDAGGNVLHRKPASNVDMPAGSSITLKVSGTLDASVQADETITNSVDITWTSTDGANPDERGGSGGVNDYNDSDDADVDIDVAALDKALIETELVEAGNAADDAVIGEKVTYTVTITVPEGVTADAVLTDTLDAGLAFVEITDVTLSAGVSSANAIGTGANPANVTVTDSGRALEFDFGDITNTNTDDGVPDTIAITYDAVALDIPGNVSGTTLDNSVAFDYTNNGAPLTDSADEITVVEPNMTIAKTVGTDAVNFAASVTDLDAGDTIYYRLRVVSNGETNAYNVTLRDTLPADLTGTSVHSVSGGGFGVGDFEVESGVVQVDDAAHPDGITVPTGTSVDIVVEATLADTVEAGQLIRNDAASVDWTSMDDGTTADEVPTQRSTHNPDSTERDNSADNPAPADVNVDTPAVDKSFRNGSISADDSDVSTTELDDLTIGEEIVFDILVTVPEGQTTDVRVRDTVSAGLRIDSVDLLTADADSDLLAADFAGSVSLNAPAVPATGPATLTLDMDDVTADSDNDADTDAFVLRVTATVVNIAGNQGEIPTTLSNTADLVFTDPDAGDTTVDDSDAGNDPEATVVEPELDITKSVDPSTADAGDPVTYTLVIENTSGQAAYDIALTDDLPDELDSPAVLGGGDFQTSGFGGAFPAPADTDFDIVAGVLQNTATIDMPDGSSITIKVSGTLDGSVAVNETITNSATVTWTSTDGANPDERDGSGGVNDYTASDDADLSVGGPALAKSLVETSEGSTPGSDVTIGETVTYALKVTLPEGSIPDLTVVDEVPAGMQYVSSSLHTTAAGSGGLLSADFAGSFTDAGEPDITGGAADGADVTFTFDAGPPAITVTGDNDADNNSFLILVTLRVLDVPGNVGVNPPGQTTLANSATLDISTDGEPPVGAGPVDVTVVEPRMVITKSMSPDPAAPGQTITVTLTVENTGTSDAFDVIVEDPLNPAHFDTATVDQGASGTDYPADFTAELDGDTVRYSGGTLADGATVTMTYSVDLTDTVAHGDSVDNTATVTQATTLPGADPDERDEPDVDDDDTLTVVAHLINGTVYHDINVNGAYDVGTDVELENVTVTLTGTDIHGAPVNRTLQTDANGFYQFDDLLPGDYTVTETQPADYLDHHETVGTNFGGTVDNTADSNVTTDITIPTGLATATTGAGYDFGEIKPNSLAGTVFADINNDGILNGADFGLESVDVTLTGTDDRGNPVSTTIQTDADGDYLFDNLRPGTYTLSETQPALYGDGIDTLGSEGGDDSVNDVFSAIDLTSKQDTDGVDYDFAEIPGTISGQVRLDVDADGDLTDPDDGRAAIPIELWTDPNGDGDPSDGTLVDTATTDIDGNYEFTGLPAGNYVVLEKDPDTDFRSTNDADGGIDEDSWNSIAVNLGPGQHVPDRDFLDTYDPPGTLAFIVNLRAIESGDRRVVEWTTGAESGTVGFHLHGVSPDGQLAPLDTQLLPSTGEPSGGIYRVEDARDAAERTLQYIIRETEDDSGTRTYGPFTADLVQHDPAEGDLWTGARERPVNAAVSATRATGETTGDALSIKVRESGVQRVTAARFGAAVGLSEEDARAAILAGDVSLRHRGRAVAYLPATDGAALLFHAPELRDPYAAYAVYTLQPGAGLLADSADGSAAGTAPNAVFVDIVHAEEDNKAIPHRIAAVEDGLWVWEKVVADTDQSVANFAIETAAPAEGDAILVLNLHGGTEAGANPDHRLDMSINGTAVGHITFDGKVPHTGAVQFDADILNARTNQVTVAAVLPEGVATSMVYVDSLDLLYPRSYGATDNAATIFADGNPVVTVGSFTASDITVLDVTAPNRIVRLDGVAVSADGDGGYAATFAPTDPDGQYAVFAGEAVIEPDSDPVSRTNLASPANAADYLIVTTAALRDAAQALADWRAADGFTVKIVTVGEIAREFAQGRPTPQAIQQFLNTAYRRWSTRPKYAVLLGKGTYDYRNADGGNDNLVPALLTRTEEGMRPSDLLFGDVVGDDAVPEIAVGRLPATTTAQAQAMIAKIIAYESAQDAYANEAVIAADKLDLAGDFTADAEAIRNRFFAGKTVRTVYLDHAEPTRGASDLRDALRDGSRLALYIGHGGFDQLARGELLAGNHVDGLDNGASLPIVLAATCHAANFSEPRRTSLSETLVLAENEGAIAVWAPTGLGFNANSAALLQAFCGAAYEDGADRLGDAATRAAERWLATVGPEELRKDAVRTFALIGDPALKLNLTTPRR